MLSRMLTFVVWKLNSAPPASRTGRLASKLKSAVSGAGYDGRNALQFQDTSTQERMLADRVRVDAYADAIAKDVTGDDVVLDLGAGSGILSFMAARIAKRVYAVEHSDVIEVAKRVGRANNFTNIEFVQANSRDFTPPEPIDVILHEQIGNELFDENLVESIVDLRTRVLRPGGRILPARFELFLEPVTLLDEYSVPFLPQMNVHGVDFSCLGDGYSTETAPRTWDLRWQHRLEVQQLLCDPEPVYKLDLMTVNPDQLPHTFDASKMVTKPGRIDGLFVYLRVDLGHGVEFDTSPTTRTSWGNRMFRVPAHDLEPGDEIAFHVDVPDVRHIKDWVVTITRPFTYRFGR